MLRAKIDRKVWFIAIAFIALLILTSFVAPRSDRQTSGSSFSRFPDGYGAWYAYMERQGSKIEQWQKPAAEFTKATTTGRTLLQVNPGGLRFGLSNSEENWVRRGNTIVVLGVPKPATRMPFTNVYGTEQGNVKIETSRRQVELEPGEKALLRDQGGAIVWERAIGKGRVIYSVTPFLAANAYQDEPGNFAFLAKLVWQNGNSIWVDEYLHGYKEKEVIQKETAATWQNYLLKTPLLPILLQTGILTLVLLWAKNRRFGQPMPLVNPTKDNNATYIQALAGVLRKANRSEFVVDVIGREEQIQIQRALGLGERLVEPEVLIDAWVTQTGRSTAELQRILPTGQSRRLSEQDLLAWLNHLQGVKQNLPQA